jgi:ribosomal-protein-alanine N-acetyltransferase
MPTRVEKKHLAAIAALERAVFHAPWTEQALELLTGGSGFGFVLMQGDTAAAYGGMLTVLDEGQITNIATHPDHRRQGYARRVVAALLDTARTRGLATVTLEVRESNAAAIALYESFGFVTVGKRPRFYTHPTETALVMALTLAGD